MNLKPAPESPSFNDSVVDWAQFTDSVEYVTSAPHYAGKKQIVLMSVPGFVYLPTDFEILLYVKNISSGTVTLKTQDGSLIDGQTDQPISVQNDTVPVVFDGENWYIL